MIIEKKVLDSYTHYAVTFNFVAPPPPPCGSGSGTILGLSVSMHAIRADADQVYSLCRTILPILHVKCLLCLKADAMCLSRVVGRPSIIPRNLRERRGDSAQARYVATS